MILKKIALVALSNPITKTENLNKLLDILTSINIEVKLSKFLINNTDILNRKNNEMALELVNFLNDNTIDGVFDISGGDLSNLILPYIPFEKIINPNACFFGYSDLTTILNAFISKSSVTIFNYQILNIVINPHSLSLFIKTFIEGKIDLTNFKYKTIRASSSTKITGITIGGNIRCFLKLAGTQYMPDLKNKILFLESYSGNEFKMLTYLNQIMSLKNFDDIKAIILGNFTEMDSENINPSIEEIFLKLTNKPLFRTYDLGHNSDAKCIRLGDTFHLTL